MKTTQNTYDRQTAKFIATLCQSIPDMSGDVMQGWIENPKSLQKVLAETLTPPDTKSDTEPIRQWREENGVIYFSVESDGTTGEDWITRLESKGFRVSDYAKGILRSPGFKSTNGVITEVAVLKGILFEDKDRITSKIRAEADKRKLSKPNAELICLIRLKFTDQAIEAMGLWYIVAMHEPIKDSDGDPRLLRANRDGSGRWLDTYYDRPGSGWRRGNGFAFSVPQVQSSASVPQP